MKKIVSLLLFIFFPLLFFSQAISKRSENKKIDSLKQLSQSYINKNDSLTRLYASQLLGLASKSNDEPAKNEAYYLIAKSYLSSSSFKALKNFDLATEYLTETNHKFLADLYFHKSKIYTLHSEFPKALENALKSLQYNQKNKLESKIQRDLSFIGYIHDRMYEFRTSIKWNRKSLKIAKKLKDTAAMARCYGRIGIAYDELAEKDGFNRVLFDSALYFNKKAVKLSELSGDYGFARITYSNIGNSYSKLKMYKKAEEYTLKSLEIPGFESHKGVTLVNLGKIYLETGRYALAEKILDSAMANTIKYGTRKYQLEAYYRFHELDVKKKNYKSALKNFIAYKSIEDSLLNKSKNKQIIETRERYQASEKENKILTQRAEIAERDLVIKNKNLFAILLSSVLLILGLLAYGLYKKKKQLGVEIQLKDQLAIAQTQNKLQEQRLRISRDLHDNIGSQLTFIISSIDNLKFITKSADKNLKNKLSTINDFASNTINQLRDTIWAMNKNEISLADFYNRMLSFIEKAKHAKTDITFNVTNTIQSNSILSSVKGINIFRVIQEAVNNAIKYAKASKINVLIEESESNITFTVSDNGKGFDINTINFGNGLENMQKRIDEVGGTLSIDSHPSKGTTITVTCTKNTINAV